MDLPQAKQDLLVQPSRARIFGFLVDRRGEAGTDEIARGLGLHPNGVRRHWRTAFSDGRCVVCVRRPGTSQIGAPVSAWVSLSGASTRSDA